MYTDIIYLVLVMLTTFFSLGIPPLIAKPFVFLLPLALFALTTILIFLQTILSLKYRPIQKATLSKIVNIELVLMIAINSFLFGTTTAMNTIPGVGGAFIAALLNICLYFSGLFTYHCFNYWFTKSSSPFKHASIQMKLILPFAIPFLFFLLLSDLMNAFNEFFFLFLPPLIALLLLSFIAMPPLVVWIWGCKPIKNQPLKERLESLCHKAHFKHGGLLDWPAIPNVLTAGILGVAPRFRYILFTKKCMETLSSEELEAVLAHEIGHTYHKHLLIYPFIFFGYFLFIALIENLLIHVAPQNLISFLNTTWGYSLLSFCYLLLFWLYFRYFFGYFSRLFERQADLHGFALGIPIETMIQVLDTIGTSTGNSHRIPNWHHHSIEKRIAFLECANRNPLIIYDYHAFVRLCIVIYFFLFFIACAILWIS